MYEHLMWKTESKTKSCHIHPLDSVSILLMIQIIFALLNHVIYFNNPTIEVISFILIYNNHL